MTIGFLSALPPGPEAPNKMTLETSFEPPNALFFFFSSYLPLSSLYLHLLILNLLILNHTATESNKILIHFNDIQLSASLRVTRHSVSFSG